MKKDFNAALKQNNAFDGFAISQTEEERAAQKGADVPAAPQTAPAQKTTTDIATETEKSKKMRRISIYMDDDKLFNNLDMYCQVHGISKNKLSQRAEMQRTQLNNYCNNTISRLDIDVLGRLCTVLDCKISDLLEFVPPDGE